MVYQIRRESSTQTVNEGATSKRKGAIRDGSKRRSRCSLSVRFDLSKNVEIAPVQRSERDFVHSWYDEEDFEDFRVCAKADAQILHLVRRQQMSENSSLPYINAMASIMQICDNDQKRDTSSLLDGSDVFAQQDLARLKDALCWKVADGELREWARDGTVGAAQRLGNENKEPLDGTAKND